MEMLLQSYRGELHLLPALPDAWPAGRVRGLRARGDIEVDIAWRQGKLERARLVARQPTPFTLLHADDYRLVDATGTEIDHERDGHRVKAKLAPGAPVCVLVS